MGIFAVLRAHHNSPKDTPIVRMECHFAAVPTCRNRGESIAGISRVWSSSNV